MENIIIEQGIPATNNILLKMSESHFHEIYQKYHPLVRSVLYKINGPVELEDLVQETFIRVWKGLEQFHHAAQLKTWIYRIAVNIAIDYQRKNKKKSFPFPLEWEAKDETQKASAISNRDLVQKGLEHLTLPHRTVLVLYCMEERTIDEIAQILETSPGTIKSRLFYAKKTMLEYFQKMEVTL